MINMFEHVNIIDVLHMQIEALLDLMQCADADCADIRSTKVAAEMCQTMLDELMQEQDKIRVEWLESKKTNSEVKTAMCDDYCRYTHAEKVECIENICMECPLNRIEG